MRVFQKVWLEGTPHLQNALCPIATNQADQHKHRKTLRKMSAAIFPPFFPYVTFLSAFPLKVWCAARTGLYLTHDFLVNSVMLNVMNPNVRRPLVPKWEREEAELRHAKRGSGTQFLLYCYIGTSCNACAGSPVPCSISTLSTKPASQQQAPSPSMPRRDAQPHAVCCPWELPTPVPERWVLLVCCLHSASLLAVQSVWLWHF